jgi:hypothetical protein
MQDRRLSLPSLHSEPLSPKHNQPPAYGCKHIYVRIPMNQVATSLLAQINALPEAERAWLIEELEAIRLQNDPLFQAQLAECERRIALVDAGEMETIPWEESMAAGRKKFQELIQGKPMEVVSRLS